MVEQNIYRDEYSQYIFTIDSEESRCNHCIVVKVTTDNDVMWFTKKIGKNWWAKSLRQKWFLVLEGTVNSHSEFYVAVNSFIDNYVSNSLESELLNE